MRVLSWNILNGGIGPVRPDSAHGASRWTVQQQLINDLRPDICLLQEARGFDDDGAAGLLRAEQQLNMRGLLALASRTGQHTAVFVRAPLTALQFLPDSEHFHHALAHAVIHVPGLASPIRVASMHLSPLSPVLRTGEVGWLAAFGAPDQFALVAGDANSLAPGDPEPQDWADLPAFQRVRYLKNPIATSGIATADRSALEFLYSAGLVDAAAAAGLPAADATATVPTRSYPDAEFVPFRSDHLLLSPSLAAACVAYSVIQDDRAHATSDHLPVMIDLDLGLLATAGAQASDESA